MNNIVFIALSDVWNQLKQGSTLVWVFVMPPIFFYFIGTVTGGFAGGVTGNVSTPLTVVAEAPGFLQAQIDQRLRENDFETTWIETAPTAEDPAAPIRTLTIADNATAQIRAGKQIGLRYETKSSALRREFEIIRVQRGIYTALADVVVANAYSDDALQQSDLTRLNAVPRAWRLDVSPAGKRKIIPSGFEQTIPGFLVMFTLLVLLTTGASQLVIERNQGLLRRLASAPISRSEVVAGKWFGRMLLAVIQVGAALCVGTFLFNMNWGPDFSTILIVLFAWAGFCATAGLLLGTLASTEGQAAGLGVLAANLLAALGGCWWPIEITPAWMQAVQKVTPTGWTMDALHKLISFQSGAAAAIPQVAALLLASLVMAAIAVRRFRYV